MSNLRFDAPKIHLDCFPLLERLEIFKQAFQDLVLPKSLKTLILRDVLFHDIRFGSNEISHSLFSLLIMFSPHDIQYDDVVQALFTGPGKPFEMMIQSFESLIQRAPEVQFLNMDFTAIGSVFSTHRLLGSLGALNLKAFTVSPWWKREELDGMFFLGSIRENLWEDFEKPFFSLF
mmetsp:Transcript_26079/g.65170  ORF Transcript_26079/g.65170 Transcript_26079/m.65170 type:complete len:176 (-) Transcript_26079:13-540(-)